MNNNQLNNNNLKPKCNVCRKKALYYQNANFEMNVDQLMNSSLSHLYYPSSSGLSELRKSRSVYDAAIDISNAGNKFLNSINIPNNNINMDLLKNINDKNFAAALLNRLSSDIIDNFRIVLHRNFVDYLSGYFSNEKELESIINDNSCLVIHLSNKLLYSNFENNNYDKNISNMGHYFPENLSMNYGGLLIPLLLFDVLNKLSILVDSIITNIISSESFNVIEFAKDHNRIIIDYKDEELYSFGISLLRSIGSESIAQMSDIVECLIVQLNAEFCSYRQSENTENN